MYEKVRLKTLEQIKKEKSFTSNGFSPKRLKFKDGSIIVENMFNMFGKIIIAEKFNNPPYKWRVRIGDLSYFLMDWWIKNIDMEIQGFDKLLEGL